MRFHIPGIPHTVTNKVFLSCAYTQRVWKLCKALTQAGHEVYHYGCEGSNPLCKEVVTIVEAAEREKYWPTDWSQQFNSWGHPQEFLHKFLRNAINEIRKRINDGDILLCPWGVQHKPIADAFPNAVVIEPGVGYEPAFARFKAFQSYAYMMWWYGRKEISDPNWYDCVIPNAVDSDEFDYCEEKDDYFLYLGRLLKLKGVQTAVQMCGLAGVKLIVAGQGQPVDISQGIDLRLPYVDFVGIADEATRRQLLSRAKAVLAPTNTLEVFGNIAIEANMSGTPVITVDWGGFVENVPHGLTGFRCRSMDHFVWAIRNIQSINPKSCRYWAEKNYSLSRIAGMYEEYAKLISTIESPEGWYHVFPDRLHLEWFERYYPSSV